MIHRYTRFMPYIRRQWSALVVILLLTMIGAAVSVLTPWPLKILVDYALGDSGLPVSAGELLAYFSLHPTPLLLIFLASIASLGLFVVGFVFSQADIFQIHMLWILLNSSVALAHSTFMISIFVVVASWRFNSDGRLRASCVVPRLSHTKLMFSYKSIKSILLQLHACGHPPSRRYNLF